MGELPTHEPGIVQHTEYNTHGVKGNVFLIQQKVLQKLGDVLSK